MGIAAVGFLQHTDNSISIQRASASCDLMGGPQFAAMESRVVKVLHTALLEGDFKLFLVLAKVSLDMFCLLCINLTRSCTPPQSMPSAAVLASDPCTSCRTNLQREIVQSVRSNKHPLNELCIHIDTSYTCREDRRLNMCLKTGLYRKGMKRYRCRNLGGTTVAGGHSH